MVLGRVLLDTGHNLQLRNPKVEKLCLAVKAVFATFSTFNTHIFVTAKLFYVLGICVGGTSNS